jgi:transcriptional regulator with XRE-family HTH domain
MKLAQRLGAVIRKRRESLGIAQEAFAYRIGVDRTYYGEIERGNTNCTIGMLEHIARKGFKIDIYRLVKEAEALSNQKRRKRGRSR